MEEGALYDYNKFLSFLSLSLAISKSKPFFFFLPFNLSEGISFLPSKEARISSVRNLVPELVVTRLGQLKLFELYF